MDRRTADMECDVHDGHDDHTHNDMNMNTRKELPDSDDIDGKIVPSTDSSLQNGLSRTTEGQENNLVVVKTKNEDDLCFRQGVESALDCTGDPGKTKNSVSSYEQHINGIQLEAQTLSVSAVPKKNDTSCEEKVTDVTTEMESTRGAAELTENRSKAIVSNSSLSTHDCSENGDMKSTTSSSVSMSTSSTTSPLSCGGKSAADDTVLLELEQALSDSGVRNEIDAGVSGLPSPWRHQVPHITCEGTSNIDITDTDSEIGNEASLKEIKDLQVQVESLQKQIDRMNKDADKARDDYYVQVQSLERTLTQERTRHQQQEDSASRLITQLRLDLNKRQQQLDTANKDRESMVVKYAMSEKSVITVQKNLELAERRLKEANSARQLLTERLKIVQSEKEKATNLLETRGQELSTANRENQRLKEDLKWTQNKLKAEVDGKKEMELKVTDLIRRLEEARHEADQARKDAQVAIKSFQESQENKAVTLDQQLREQQARLILERHERADHKETMKQLQAEVEALKQKQQALITENNQLSVKVQTLEKDRLDGDQRVSRLKLESDSHQQEVADLRAKIAGIESLRAQLQHCEEQLAAGRSEMERLRLANVELQQDAGACREREAELLEFTQKLTEKNVRLQSEFSATEAKARMLESEQIPLQRRLAELELRTTNLAKQLEEEQTQRQEENSLLARHLAERTHRAQQLQHQLEDSQGEIEVLKRKHATSLRELTRELQQVRKRLEAAENNGGSSSSGSMSLGQGSRASSTSSLNTVCEPTATPPVVFPSGQEPDRQALIDRLVRLQRESARKAEKLDFMEEHVQTLVAELQKKSRIIQSYVMRAPAGALSSDTMDQNKAELAKRGGIMASMYGTKMDDTMTLELSMEINRKLQAVLEDTLLKNITLKESIDTLGSEIARLSK